MRIPLTLVILWSVILLTVSLSAQEIDFSQLTSELDPTRRREFAVEIAKLAAAKGDFRLSLEAARRATTAIKVASSSTGQGLLEATDQAESSGMHWCNWGNDRNSSEARMGNLLTGLNEQWKQSAIEPVECYVFWRDCVFPPDRPNDAQLLAFQRADQFGSRYRRALATDEVPKCTPEVCAPLCLVEWAKRANCIQELLQFLEQRSAFPNSATIVGFTQTLLGCEGLLPEEFKTKLLQSLAQDMQSVMETEDAEVLLSGWISFAESEHGKAFHKPILEAVVRLKRSAQWPLPTPAADSIARQLQIASRTGDFETFKAYVPLLHSDGVESNVLFDVLVNASLQDNAEIAKAAVENLVQDSSHISLYSLLDIESPISTAFLGLNPELRYLAIDKYIWKDNLLWAGVFVEKELRREQTPDWISKKLHSAALADHFGRGNPVSKEEEFLPLTLLEIYLRDAISSGKASEVSTSIEKLSAPNKKMIARAAMQLALGQPVDFIKTTQGLCDGDLQTETLFTYDDEATYIHVAIAQSAIRAKVNANQIDKMIAWIDSKFSPDRVDSNNLRRLYNDVRDFNKDQAVHHVKTKTLQSHSPFKPTNNWRTGDRLVECTPGQDSSSWTVPLPLPSDFSAVIQVRSDQKHTDFALYFGGSSLCTGDELEIASGRIQLVHREGETTIQIGNGIVKDVYADPNGFPFLNFHCGAGLSMQVTELTVDGKSPISSEVDMLSSALNGWFAYHPRDLLNNGPDDGQNGTSWRYRQQELQSESKPSSGQIRNWLDGSRESLICYSRPLYDQEAIEYEFFYQSGAFYVAPCIGRLAIDIESKPIQAHWITTDGGKWWSIEENNRVMHPNARQLAEPVLNAGWNRCQVRIEDSQWIVAINGKDVYEQTIQPIDSTLFGLYHDPQQVKVRVRNMRLSGKNWPSEVIIGQPHVIVKYFLESQK